MKKLAGILDKYNKVLPLDVWTLDGKKMLPQLREHILKNLYSWCPKENIKEIFVIGAITGYQYTETTDIDINVALFPEELVTTLWESRRSHSSVSAPGTRRVVNYFLVPWKGKDTSWQDSYFGIYDLLKDKWAMEPVLPNDTRDPFIKYHLELSIAEMFSDKFIEMLDSYYKDLNEYHKIEKNSTLLKGEKLYFLKVKGTELRDKFVDLVYFINDIDKNRKFEYNWGWGIPRTNFRNILYKFVLDKVPEKYNTILNILENLKAYD